MNRINIDSSNNSPNVLRSSEVSRIKTEPNILNENKLISEKQEEKKEIEKKEEIL